MLRIAFSLLKLLARIVLLLYFVAGGLFLGVRYWLLPNIDQWRPQIAKQLSSALDVTVSLGPISADWGGLRPRLAMSDVTLTDRRQRKVLDLPHVQVELSWRSLAMLTPQFSRIEASGVDLSVRRDRFDRFWIMGLSFEPGALDQHDTGVRDKLIAWLASQRELVLRDSTLRWLDETRTQIPLVFGDVAVVLQNRGADHRFSLKASPPAELGRSIDLRGEFRQLNSARGQPFSLQNSAGKLYAHVERMSPLGWSIWIDTPRKLLAGEVSAKGWIEVSAGRIEHYTSDMTAWKGRWGLNEFHDGAHIEAESLRLFLAGAWSGFQQVFPALAKVGVGGQPALEPVPSALPGRPVEVRLTASAISLQAPDMFRHSMRFDEFDAKGSARNNPDSLLRLDVERLNLSNGDIQGSLSGNWQEGASGSGGQIDVYGRFPRALIASIDEYLPNAISQEARDWMATGLLGGRINDAALSLNGDLAHFPFADDPSKGTFRVTGQFSEGVIDYVPAEGKSLGWPRITDMRGRVALSGADLRLVADQAVMRPDSKLPIHLSNVSAHIPDLDDNPVLTIRGTTQGEAQTYLALMTHSPLGELLDGELSAATADGKWEVPLTLSIPLLNSRDATVQGGIRFSGNGLRLSPAIPPFTDVSGTLNFTDTGISTNGVKAGFLGGPVSLSGGVGGAMKGLRIQGQMSVAALTELVGVQGMNRLHGTVPYMAFLRRPDHEALSLAMDSDLTGLALDLPPPLGKAAAHPLPLRVNWHRHSDGKSMVLGITLGKNMNATLLHDARANTGAYFHSAALGVDQNPQLPDAGVSVDVRYPFVDVDVWDRVITEFSTPLPGTKQQQKQALLPDLRQLRLQTGQARALGLVFDELTFTARRPAVAQWRVDISSSQTAGTLFWREAHRRVAGRVDAHFDRMALGSEGEHGATEGTGHDEPGYQISDDLDIPGVNLYVKNLRLYGRDAGELSVVGVNQARGRLWQLEQLQLNGPGAMLTGSGTWRLSGKDRGLALNAQAQFSDLGKYLTHAGFEDIMKGGVGKAVGQFEWRNIPWGLSKAALSGKVDLDLEKGRFSSLNSRSSRLLELLSMQSLQRLARMDVNPAGLIKEGFPYDRLRGSLKVHDGVMNTDDYRVVGPVGTIVIAGDVDLIREQLDLEAVVVPNLDVSGAAIAAGIAINPIVGIGAFLTQWLLQAPLAKAMTVQYHIDGDWDDPRIRDAVVPSHQSSGTGARKEPEPVPH